MKTYLTILAVLMILSFASSYASAQSPLLNQGEQMQQSIEEWQIMRNQMQRRMNQQYYNERLQDEIRQQQNDTWYLQQQEHLRNQGWGRPGLDDGGVR